MRLLSLSRLNVSGLASLAFVGSLFAADPVPDAAVPIPEQTTKSDRYNAWLHILSESSQKKSKGEQKLTAALDRQTTLEFSDNTLKEVVDFIQQLHNIPIRLDTNALEDAGLDEDTRLSLVVSGVTLRSALTQMLKDVNGTELTFTIEDEVLKITTAKKANATRGSGGTPRSLPLESPSQMVEDMPWNDHENSYNSNIRFQRQGQPTSRLDRRSGRRSRIPRGRLKPIRSRRRN